MRALALRTALGCVGTLVLWSCHVDIPEGVFACETSASCPNGWACRSDGYCYKTPGQNAPEDGGADGAVEESCTPGSCPEGQICNDGTCVETTADEDGDGVPTASDCDDADKNVGVTAQRECQGACAPGIQRCTMGTWGECEAEDTCDCEPGEKRMVPCGNCGQQSQECSGQGTWVNQGECTGAGECSPGKSETGEPCGKCGTQRRNCIEGCKWDAWYCHGEGTCSPGQSEPEVVGCGTCGEEKSRSRSCSESCEWGDWGAWGACNRGDGCIPGTLESDSRECGNCEKGMQARTARCTTECAWGAWGAWGTCENDTGCAPLTHKRDTKNCGNCNRGTSERLASCVPSTCEWGAWGAWGTCNGDGVCAPTTTQSRPQSCGMCGTQTLTRTCDANCSWGDFVPSECSGQGVCSQGAVDTRTEPCGNCGKRSSTRSCSDLCQWGSWGAWTACQSQGSCAPGLVAEEGPTFCTTKLYTERCHKRTCSARCEWGAWGTWYCQ